MEPSVRDGEGVVEEPAEEGADADQTDRETDARRSEQGEDEPEDGAKGDEAVWLTGVRDWGVWGQCGHGGEGQREGTKAMPSGHAPVSR